MVPFHAGTVRKEGASLQGKLQPSQKLDSANFSTMASWISDQTIEATQKKLSRKETVDLINSVFKYLQVERDISTIGAVG